jgi:hypothetical protein
MSGEYIRHPRVVTPSVHVRLISILARRIKRLVKQLFFRLNQQQFRNKKYKLKNNSEIKPADTRGLSEQSPIDVDAITTDPGQSSGTALYGGTTALPSSSLINLTRVNEAPPHEPHTSPDRGDQNGTDIYAVPPSPPVSPGICGTYKVLLPSIF